jgi:hypothetical protein
MEELIELDDRRRVALGKVGKPEHRRYLAETHPDGTIILKPAVVVTEAQVRLWANPEVSALLDAEVDAHKADPTTSVRGRGIPKRRS